MLIDLPSTRPVFAYARIISTASASSCTGIRARN